MKKFLACAQRELNSSLSELDVVFEDSNALPVSLTPYTIEKERYLELKDQCEAVLGAIEKVLREWVNNPGLAELFPELQKYTELLKYIPKYDRWVHLTRFDLVERKDGKFLLIETNADCPGAVTTTPLVKRAHNSVPGLADLRPEESVRQKMDNPTYFLNSLVSLHKSVYPDSPSPVIALLTSKYRELRNEISCMKTIGKKAGMVIEDLRIQDLDRVGNRTGWGNTTIDVAYQKFDAFIEEDGMARWCTSNGAENDIDVYMQAIGNDHFLYVNSIQSSLIAENKRILDILRNGKVDNLFTTKEKNAISALIPPTYSLYSMKDDNEKFSNIIQNKEKYVLKKVIETRGRGVIVGRDTDDASWLDYVTSTVGGPYIIQEYVEQEPVKILSSSENPQPLRVYQVLSVFLVGGETAGLYARSSPDRIVSVAGGAVSQPVYVVA